MDKTLKDKPQLEDPLLIQEALLEEMSIGNP